jgi:hypothetical protein
MLGQFGWLAEEKVATESVKSESEKLVVKVFDRIIPHSEAKYNFERISVIRNLCCIGLSQRAGLLCCVCQQQQHFLAATLTADGESLKWCLHLVILGNSALL